MTKAIMDNKQTLENNKISPNENFCEIDNKYFEIDKKYFEIDKNWCGKKCPEELMKFLTIACQPTYKPTPIIHYKISYTKVTDSIFQ